MASCERHEPSFVRKSLSALPGILLLTGVAVFSWFITPRLIALHPFMKSLNLSDFIVAIILGMVICNTVGVHAVFRDGLRFSTTLTKTGIVVMGCKNIEKDTELFNKIAEALAGKNILVLSARDENYKTVGASAGLAYNQKVGAESAVDINLAKQLNTVMTQLGVSAQSIVMNIGSAAAGYGYEYVASTLDRVKDAALKQADAMLEMPIMTPVSADTWGVKEAVMSEEDMPEWGSQEERGIEMEITTAAALVDRMHTQAGGSDAVILRHPEAIKTIAKMISALM